MSIYLVSWKTQALISSYEILQQHWENNLPRKQQQLRNFQQQVRQHPMFARCSRRRQNFVSHEAESFARRECDVITARPIERPKTLRAFAYVHRSTKLGSVLLRRTQWLLLLLLLLLIMRNWLGYLHNGGLVAFFELRDNMSPCQPNRCSSSRQCS